MIKPLSPFAVAAFVFIGAIVAAHGDDKSVPAAVASEVLRGNWKRVFVSLGATSAKTDFAAVADLTRTICRTALVLAYAATSGGCHGRPTVQPADLAESYQWRPVAIGAGGWVTGFVSHPLDATVRYCRTDVGNAYRWDAGAQRWAPMLVCNGDRKGIPADLVRAPGGTGVDSIAVDASNKRVVLVAFPITHSQDVADTAPSLDTSVYRSEDGGITFTKSSLAVPGDPNGKWRYFGERLKVDPHNPRVVYFGTPRSGLYRSFDGGLNWSRVAGGVPQSGDIVNVQISASEGAANVQGRMVSRVVYCVVGDGDVFRSEDGGRTWSNTTQGTRLSGHAAQSTLDQTGTLYVAQNDSNVFWKFTGGRWAPSPALNLWDGVQNVAVDPSNAKRLFVLGRGGNLLRSVDGGATWTAVARQFNFANTLGWLPQGVPGWRSNSGICFDRDGVLWVAQGNEGMLRCRPSDANTETEANPIRWTIDSAGIEELCTQDVILPKGGGGKAYVAVNDATGMVIDDPATFSARWIGLETKGLIAHGCGVASCPNDPAYVAIAVGGAHGYTDDGGRTWKRFASQYPPELATGSIAISRRGAWSAGADHLVILPANNRPPYFSKDGGKTWTVGKGFPVGANGAFEGGQDGYWGYFLKQRLLRADPFVPDHYYLKLTSLGFWVSSDGGETWRKTSDSLPVTHHGELDVNQAVRNDLWLCDGYEGSHGGAFSNPHGVFHSKDAGATWERAAGMDFAITLALGRGQSGSSYAVYVYGKRAGDDRWGVFRSTDAGATWNRISYYPAGIFDRPACMAASWDTYGLVYVGFGGQSYVYGKPRE